MKSIAVANQKGGVGKTTITAALGAGLTARGFKVLLIDLDPQTNLSASLGVRTGAKTILDVLTNATSASATIQHTAAGDLMPGNEYLTVRITDANPYALKQALNSIRTAYDYCLMDCPPSLGTLTLNALTAADSVLIPAAAEAFSLQALTQIARTIRTVRSKTNPELAISGIVLNRYNPRTIVSRDLAAAISEQAAQMGTVVYASRIRQFTAINEAQATQQDIFTYAATSAAANVFTEFIDEFLKGEQNHAR